MKMYVADFETTVNDPTKTRVWAFATCNIDNWQHVEYGICIDDYIKWCEKHPKSRVYFHNLDFDGNFILNYLIKNNWKWVDDIKEASFNTYTALIGDCNQIYSLTIYFSPTRYVEFYDSAKVIQLKVKNIPKAFGIEDSKGLIDYKADREIGHELTEEEKDYIKRDVQIVAQAMKIMLSQKMDRMTAASNSLAAFKSMIGKQAFDMQFPKLEIDEDKEIRKAYKGGFTYVNPKFQGKILNNGIVLDVNSLYPSVMHCCNGERMPCDYPYRFEGEPPYFGLGGDSDVLWVAEVTCIFYIKKDHIPCIQLKGNMRFRQTEYLEDSRGEVSFWVTNVDWALICQQYNLEHVKWHGGYKFLASKRLFNRFIDENMELKAQATIEGNRGLRSIAKLRMNSLYGKFGTRPTALRRKPVLNEKTNGIKFVDIEDDIREPIYIPIAVFVTSWARYKTITSAQSVFDRFIYADTDSLHLIGDEPPKNLEIDDVKLGAWKLESKFSHAKFLRSKCYIEEDYVGNNTVHVAGMPEQCHSQVTFENFTYGAVYEGKLYRKNIDGGVILYDGPIEIRRN